MNIVKFQIIELKGFDMMKKFCKILMIALVAMFILQGCSQKQPQAKDVDLHELLTTIIEREDMPSMMVVEEDLLSDLYYFSSEDAKQFAIAMPLMNVRATEIILIEANEGHLDNVKSGIEKRLQNLDEIWSHYLADQYELVQNAQFVEIGNYYCVIIAEDAQELAESIKEALQ